MSGRHAAPLGPSAITLAALLWAAGPGGAQPAELQLPGTGPWQDLQPWGDRFAHSAIYDPVRHRMIVFGGWTTTPRNDVWALSLSGPPIWTQIVVSGESPTPRLRHAAIYDPVRDRMIVFGGFATGPLNDAWALSLGDAPEWTELTPRSGLMARSGASAIYDPVDDRMIIFGGDVPTINQVVAEPWALNLSGPPVWSAVIAGGDLPGPRSRHVAIYDPLRHRMIIHGGIRGGTCRGDTWALSLAPGGGWQALPPTPPTLPFEEGGRRYDHIAVYDPPRDRLVLFGGLRSTGSFCLTGGGPVNDVWALPLGGGGWTPIEPARAAPSPRREHAAVYDPARSRLVTFGGVTALPRRDVWSLSLSGPAYWVELLPPVPEPSGRSGHVVVRDPVRNRLILFGGDDGRPRNDTWILPLSGIPGWSRMDAIGTPPAARSGHTAVYDPPRDRVLIFGGDDGGPGSGVWSLALAGAPTWTPLTPAGIPPSARQWHSAIHDPVRDRMIVFAGTDGVRGNDVWALSLAGTGAWTQLSPSGVAPSGRIRHSAVYDPPGDRMIVFGGNDGSDRNDVWALSLGSSPEWSVVPATGTPPAGRSGHVAAYDPRYHRMILFAGYAGTRYKSDAWALSLDAAPQWTRPNTGSLLPPLRTEAAGFVDIPGDRLVVFGGRSPTRLSDTWALDWSGAVAVSAPSTTMESHAPISSEGRDGSGRLRILSPAVRPVPAHGTVEITFGLPGPAELRLHIFDLQGREVSSPRDVAGVAGVNRTIWSPRDGHETLQPGVYFYLLEQRGGGVNATARGRFVLIP